MAGLEWNRAVGAENPVAQTSKSAVSRVTKPACRPPIQRAQPLDAKPIWKSAKQQVWKPALRGTGPQPVINYQFSIINFLKRVQIPHQL